MTDPVKTAQDDLAFMRNLVDQGGRVGTTGGSLFLAGGLLYGFQCLFHWAEHQDLIRPSGIVNLIAALGPTVVFIALLAVVMARDAKSTATGGASRALQAMFAGTGLANLAMVLVFGVNAATHPGFPVWLFYPPVIFALQGAAWFVVWRLRKRGWLGAVAIGWFAAAIALGLSVDVLDRYILIAAGSLFLLMAVPGAVMMRLASRDA